MKKLSIFGFGLLVMTGCTHQPSVDRKVEAELRQEPSIAMGGPVAMESRRVISESTTLSETQKEKLLALHERMAAEVAMMRDEEGKLKMVLFRTLLNPGSEEAEIANLKVRILELNSKKTKKMLSALEETRQILGRPGKDSEKIFRAFNL